MTNQTSPSASEGIQLIHELASALTQWTAVPPGIIHATLPKVSDRSPAQQLLVRGARKLCEDLGAAVSLLEQGFAGPPHVLVRVCRENLVPMLYLALAPPPEQTRFAQFLSEQKPAAARLKLHHLAKSLLAGAGGALPAAARNRFDAAILDDEQLRRDEGVAKRDPAASDYAFNRAVGAVAEFLRRDHGDEANAFLTTVIDYWIESEVVHNGFDAIEAYHIDGGEWHTDLHRICNVLTLLMDLRVVAALASTALLQGFGVSGRMPLPVAVQALQTAAASAREFLRRFPPAASSSPEN